MFFALAFVAVLQDCVICMLICIKRLGKRLLIVLVVGFLKCLLCGLLCYFFRKQCAIAIFEMKAQLLMFLSSLGLGELCLILSWS